MPGQSYTITGSLLPDSNTPCATPFSPVQTFSLPRLPSVSWCIIPGNMLCLQGKVFLLAHGWSVLCLQGKVSLLAHDWSVLYLQGKVSLLAHGWSVLCLQDKVSLLAHDWSVLCLQGKVSLLAHSLGSVLCYEILRNQPHLFNHLEFNIHNSDSPTDASQSPAAQTQSEQSTQSAQLPSKLQQQQHQQQQQQQQTRQASTEIVFAPMSSGDLDGSVLPPRSYPPYPRQSVRSQAGMSHSLGSAAAPSGTAQVRTDACILVSSEYDVVVTALAASVCKACSAANHRDLYIQAGVTGGEGAASTMLL